MKNQTIEGLLEILLHSSNDAWRDDAAEDLANCKEELKAERALFEAIVSPKLDDSLRRTCAESLAVIWIRSGHVEMDKLDKLAGMARQVVEEHLKTENLLPNK